MLILTAFAGAYFYYFKSENPNNKPKQRLESLKTKEEAESVKTVFKEINEAVNLMDSVKDEMPKELLEVHQFLLEKGKENEIKFYQIPPEMKDFIMFHGAKSQVLYLDPEVRLKPQIWIPLLYHEVGHLLWHQKHPVSTFEEFQAQLFESEKHSYTVDAQAWNLVRKHFLSGREGLSALEKKLFNLYERETVIYNKMVEGDLEAKKNWIEIIRKDIEAQKKYQRTLKK